MPSFPKPKFAYTVDVNAEIARLRAHKQERVVPKKSANRLLLATWNIANFGEHQREDEHPQLITEVLSWFDVVAVQGAKESFGPLEDLLHLMGSPYSYVMSDIPGSGSGWLSSTTRRR
jgi:hypothetical protein